MAKKKDNTVWIVVGIIAVFILGGGFNIIQNSQLSPVERLEKLMMSECRFSLESPEPTIFVEDFSELQSLCDPESLESVFTRVCIADINGVRATKVSCLNFEELKSQVNNLPSGFIY